MGAKKYWHISSVDSCILFYGTYEEVSRDLIDGNHYGPFNTLGECKKDAIAFHRCTINYAQVAIRHIKETRLIDIK